jgi:subtilisin family serine protease
VPLAQLQVVLGSDAEYIHPDQTLQTAVDAIVANDPGFTTNTANIDKQWGLAKARFPEAWRKTTGSTKTVVAVVDTGIDQTHEDFANTTFVPGYNVPDNKAIGLRTNSDDNGHGTLVAGIIGASSNNAVGVTGANWQVSLMPVKALNSAGSGEASDLAQGIVWAADNGAQIINLSVGGLGFAHDLTLAFQFAMTMARIWLSASQLPTPTI